MAFALQKGAGLVTEKGAEIKMKNWKNSNTLNLPMAISNELDESEWYIFLLTGTRFRFIEHLTLAILDSKS